jgi:hypothetical protein
MAGLDPAIQLLAKTHVARKMDPRVKPGGDGGVCIRVTTQSNLRASSGSMIGMPSRIG